MVAPPNPSTQLDVRDCIHQSLAFPDESKSVLVDGSFPIIKAAGNTSRCMNIHSWNTHTHYYAIISSSYPSQLSFSRIPTCTTSSAPTLLFPLPSLSVPGSSYISALRSSKRFAKEAFCFLLKGGLSN